MTTIPDPLLTAFTSWRSAGRPTQIAFRWNPDAWTRRFARSTAPRLDGVDLAESVRTIADAARSDLGEKNLIDRGVVESLHSADDLKREGGTAPQAVATAFIAAMIWGYGTTGYGPYRTERVLASDPQIVDHLLEIARISRSTPDGGLKAFATIAERKNEKNYLKYLGPAFGTKFLYFLTAAADGVEPTPVMDAVVRRWFAAEPKIALSTIGWDTSSYETYLNALDDWREQLSSRQGGEEVTRADVELLIFSSARGDDFATTKNKKFIASDDLSIDQLLDLLQPGVDELAESRGGKGPEPLKQLSEWVTGSPGKE